MMLRWTLLLALLPLTQVYASSTTPAPPAREIVLCDINGMIDEGLAVVVERAVARATDAEALIFVIDTPGGRVDSAIRITNAILAAPCKTVAYVKGMGAISAGAIISYACDVIMMTPESNFGASTPITMGPDQPTAVDEKSMSFVRAKYRALGEAKGHDPLLGEAMVDPDIEVRGIRNEKGVYTFYRPDAEAPAKEDAVGEVFNKLEREVPLPLDGVERVVRDIVGTEEESKLDTPVILPDGSEVVSRPGELLTLTSQEARRYGLSEATVADVNDVVAHLGLLDAARHHIEVKWSEALFRWLTSPLISGLLLMLGLAGVYTEIKAPGFGLPGILGAVCLGLFFGAYLVIGLADWIDVVLVIVGVALVLVEVFLLPGVTLAGVAGVFCIFAGIYFALTRVTIPEYSWDFLVLRDAGITMSVASALFLLFVAAFWKFFPRTPMYGWIVLQHEQHPELGYTVQTSTDTQTSVGLRGVAVSVLRPAGRGRFGDKTYDVVTRDEYIDPGTPIVIIRAEGNRYVVAPRNEETH